MGNSICSIFKNPLFYIVLTALTCFIINVGINVSVAYLIIFLVNRFLSLYYYLKYILIPILLFVYNYLILRTILRHWLFEWQFPFQIFSIYKERQNYLAFLKERVNHFINAIDVLIDERYRLTLNEIQETKYFLNIFDDEFYIYDNLYNIVFSNNGIHNNNLIRYKMSNNQVRYYNLLKGINNLLNQNDLRNKLINLKEDDTSFKKEENNGGLIQLKLRINEMLALIEKYNWENYTYMSPAYIWNLLFNDTFGSLSLYSLQFKKNFQEYSLEENYTPNGKIHYTLIRNNKENKNNNKIEIAEENNLIEESDKQDDDGVLLFFCLPNGGCYELIPKSKIDFYLVNGFSFLCWNYRGYGFSKGTSNFSNCKSDALELFDTITKNPKYHFKKICVMGHSIGGVPLSFLEKNRKIDLAISDRNFCDIPRIAKNFHCGDILSILVQFFLIGKSYIIDDFMDESIFSENNSNGINRIVIYSPIDSIIYNDCTMKSGIARYIIKNYIIYKDLEKNVTIKSKENLLDIVFNSNEKNLFLNDLIELIHLNHDRAFDDNINDKLYQEAKEKSPDEKKNDVSFSFFDKFYGICTDNLSIISELATSKRREKLFLDSFFNNLLIWGAQGEDIFPNEEIYEFYPKKGFKIIKEAFDVLNKAFPEENIINNNSLSKKILLLIRLKTYFGKIYSVMKNLDIDMSINNKRMSLRISNLNNTNFKEKLIGNEDEEEIEIKTNSDIKTNIETEKNLIDVERDNLIKEDNNNFYQKLNSIIGNIRLFRTIVGHNGPLRADEREQFFYLLLKSGIVC